MVINIKYLGPACGGEPLYKQMDAPGYEPGVSQPSAPVLIWDEEEKEIIAISSVEELMDELEFMEFYWME